MPSMKPGDTTKICSTCQRTLLPSGFNKHRRTPDGLRTNCKDCQSAAYQASRGRPPRLHADYRAAHKYDPVKGDYVRIYEATNDRRLASILAKLPGVRPDLNEKEYRVVHLRMGGLTYQQIGEIVGVTRERIRQIFAKAVRKYARAARKMDPDFKEEEWMAKYRTQSAQVKKRNLERETERKRVVPDQEKAVAAYFERHPERTLDPPPEKFTSQGT